MLDLLHSRRDLQAWGVCVVTQPGLQSDLRSAPGKLMAFMMAALAEYEKQARRIQETIEIALDMAKKLIEPRTGVPLQGVTKSFDNPVIIAIGRLAGFRYCDIIRRVKALGFEFHRQAPYIHEICYRCAMPHHHSQPSRRHAGRHLGSHPQAGQYRNVVHSPYSTGAFPPM